MLLKLGQNLYQFGRLSSRRTKSLGDFRGGAIRSITEKMAKEVEPYKYDELPIDVPPADPTSEKIAGLVEEIISLNVLEYGQFLKRIQLRSGISDEVLFSRFGNTMLYQREGGDDEVDGIEEEDASVGGGAAPVKEAEVVKEKEFFDVKLGTYDAKAKIKIIKEIRTITGLGLKEVRTLSFVLALL